MDISIKGEIVDDDWGPWLEWWGYDVTYPKKVLNKISEANGEPLVVKINSPGGDIFAASEIYSELREYKGDVLIKIVGLCASAGSVIAMAGTSEISPTAMLMVHNVATGTYGDYREMEKTSETLKVANDTIANSYICKTGMSREEALDLMNNETYISAEKAIELKLVDKIMFEDSNKVDFSTLNNLKANNFSNYLNPFEKIKDFANKFGTNNHPNSNEGDFLIQNYQKKLNDLKKKESKLNV